MNVHVKALPVEMHGTSGLEGDVVLPLEVYQGKMATRVDFSIELVNKMGMWGILEWMLPRVKGLEV